jgi:hypothetical protein
MVFTPWGPCPRRLERHQPGFLWMDGQPIFPKPFGECLQDPPGILFPFTADDEIITVANEASSALESGLDYLHPPFIQDIMEVDIRPHRGDHTSWWGTLSRVKQFSSVLYSGVEPSPYEPVYSSIMDASV